VSSCSFEPSSPAHRRLAVGVGQSDVDQDHPVVPVREVAELVPQHEAQLVVRHPLDRPRGELHGVGKARFRGVDRGGVDVRLPDDEQLHRLVEAQRLPGLLEERVQPRREDRRDPEVPPHDLLVLVGGAPLRLEALEQIVEAEALRQLLDQGPLRRQPHPLQRRRQRVQRGGHLLGRIRPLDRLDPQRLQGLVEPGKAGRPLAGRRLVGVLRRWITLQPVGHTIPGHERPPSLRRLAARPPGPRARPKRDGRPPEGAAAVAGGLIGDVSRCRCRPCRP
jgi:hypothetical protein